MCPHRRFAFLPGGPALFRLLSEDDVLIDQARHAKGRSDSRRNGLLLSATSAHSMRSVIVVVRVRARIFSRLTRRTDTL